MRRTTHQERDRHALSARLRTPTARPTGPPHPDRPPHRAAGSAYSRGMSTTLLCQHCGAPWQPDVTGACRFCRVAAPPPGARAGVTAGRPMVDGDAFFRILLAQTAQPATGQPLDRLAAVLRSVAGERVNAVGAPVGRLQLALDDWIYEAWIDHGDVSALAVHTVRGVVLKRQPMAFDEWVACVAAHLAEYASTHPHIYEAIVALDSANQGRTP